MAFFFKWILVLASLVGGGLFLVRGIGIAIPFVKYQGLEAHGVPVGIAFLATGVALAVFWRVKTTITIEELYSTTSSDGSSSESRKSSKYESSFKTPGS